MSIVAMKWCDGSNCSLFSTCGVYLNWLQLLPNAKISPVFISIVNPVTEWNLCSAKLCILRWSNFEDAFDNTQGGKWNKCNQCDFAFWYTAGLRTHIWKHTMEKSQRNINNKLVWLCIISGIWKHIVAKTKQMQPMWLYIFLCRHFQESFENTQQRI